MAKKLMEFYTPIKAHQLLKNNFSTNPVVTEIINKMSRTHRCVFAALCDGQTITTNGYSIPADYSVNRAPAIAHALRELNLPIESKYAPAISDTGGVTRQSIFYMRRTMILRLHTEPSKVITECSNQRAEKKWNQAKGDIERLYREFGKAVLLKMIEDVSKKE